MKRKHFGFLIFIPFLFAACDNSKVKKLGEGGGASTEVAVDESAFFIRVTKSTASNNPSEKYLLHTLEGGIGVDNDWTKTCNITKAQIKVGTTDIICIAEAPELDLYNSGINITYNVPGDVCDHFRFRPYSYFAYEPGTVNLVTSTCGQAPPCAYDYTGRGGPNCCTGTWTDVGNGSCTTAPASGEYDGNYGDCLSGPGATSEYVNTKKQPLTIYTDLTKGDGLVKSLDVVAPITKSFGSNVYASNYYNPADHAAMTTTTNSRADLGTKAPAAYDYFIDYNGFGFKPSPFYSFECVDRHDEVKARIRLMVREWNTTTVTQGQDHDTTGSESSPFDYDGKNDFGDWKDFNTNFPKGAQ